MNYAKIAELIFAKYPEALPTGTSMLFLLIDIDDPEVDKLLEVLTGMNKIDPLHKEQRNNICDQELRKLYMELRSPQIINFNPLNIAKFK